MMIACKHIWIGPRLILLAVLAMAIAGGCSSSAVAPCEPIDIVASEYSRMVQAAVLVLRDRGFRVDRQDHRFGRVTTHPIPVPTVFEPWDNTNTTSRQALEGTINNQRRLVSVMFDPTVEQEGASGREQGYTMAVEVAIERLQVPTRQLTGSTDGPNVFKSFGAVPTELQRRGIEGPYWQRIARDPYLERQLMERIVRRSMTLPAPAPNQEADGPAATEGL